jgi:serine/threonine protein phosphatase PrpC
MTDQAPAAPVATTGEPSPLDDVSPISAVTARRGPGGGPDAGARPPCLQCGGEVDDDGYCTQCGTKAPDPRDHFEEQPAPWVAGVCDRGIRHHRNEDAMAMAVDGQRVVLVVCDGVSNTVDSHVGSMNAVRAVLDVLRPPLPRGIGVPESRAAAITQVFTDAAAAGQRAIVATVTDDVPNPPSCTLVAAVMEDGVIHYCGLGDSRVYLLPDAGDGQILTVDDSMAQLLIAGGTPRAEAEAAKQAHSITKWLGKDSTEIVPRVGQVEVTGPGWLLACSDGLWNYASEPAALRAQLDAAGSPDPLAISRHLVEFANECGGQDNIAVALARVGETASPLVEEGALAPVSRPGDVSADGGPLRDASSLGSSGQVATVAGATSSTDAAVGNNAAPDGGESHG